MFVEIIGFAGAFFFLWSFYEVTSGKWKPDSYRYELLSLTSGVLLITYGLYKDAFANILVNVTFAIICLMAIHRTYKKYHYRKNLKRNKKKSKVR